MGGRHPPLEGLAWDHHAGLHLRPALEAACPSCPGGPSLRSGQRGPEAVSGLQTEVMSFQPSRLRGTKLLTPRMPTGAGARTSVSSPLGVWRAAASPGKTFRAGTSRTSGAPAWKRWAILPGKRAQPGPAPGPQTEQEAL